MKLQIFLSIYITDFTVSNSSASTSTLTSYSSQTSSNLSTAPPNSSRRNTKSSISSNQNSSSSEIGEGPEDCLTTHKTTSIQQRKKSKSPSLRMNTTETPASEVSAHEFLTRMDMSIEATRKNLKKSSNSIAQAESSIDSRTASESQSPCTSSSATLGDEDRIMC